MSYAFISHAVKADGAFAMRLANDLRARNVRIWKAPESIKPGEKWAQAIETAVETCDTMLTILTPEAVASRWVSTEMNMAIDREHEGKMSVLPLDLKPCKVPRLWAQYQRIPFASYATGLKELLDRLGVSSSVTKTPLSANTGWPSGVDPAPAGENRKSVDRPIWDLPTSSTPPLLKVENPLEKYLAAEKKPGVESGSLADIFSSTSPITVMSEEWSGNKARQKLDYRKAIQHYTKAIENYQRHDLLQSEWHKRALGAIYYKRGQCWMSLDLWSSLGEIEKTTPWDSLLPKPKGISTIGPTFRPLQKYGLGAIFPSLLQVRDEYTNAQADFSKAKELGYEPEESAEK